MIQLNHSYSVLFAVTSAGVGTAADSTPTAVLYRNGSASGVTVTVSTTAQTGLYKATFTTDSGWSSADHLELYATATIGGTSGYLAKVWSSTEYASTFAAGSDAVIVGSMQANTLTAAALAADAGAELAALVEAYIVNEGDATAVMQAIADKIAADWVAGDASPLAIATAVWSAATRTLTAVPDVTVGGYASGQSPADLVSMPSEAAIAAEVDSVLTAAHGSGGWTTAVLSSVTVGGYASGKSPAEALIDHLETQTRGKGSLSYLKMLELNTAALLGKASAPSDSTETFVYADGVTNAFTVTFDANGYRTGVTIEN